MGGVDGLRSVGDSACVVRVSTQGIATNIKPPAAVLPHLYSAYRLRTNALLIALCLLPGGAGNPELPPGCSQYLRIDIQGRRHASARRAGC
jgi:hypothetical protein